MLMIWASERIRQTDAGCRSRHGTPVFVRKAQFAACVSLLQTLHARQYSSYSSECVTER